MCPYLLEGYNGDGGHCKIYKDSFSHGSPQTAYDLRERCKTPNWRDCINYRNSSKFTG